MWNSIEKFGLSNKEIKAIRKKLWEKEDATHHCHDCGVAPGEFHQVNCDVARCPKCKSQHLSCECEEWHDTIWEGLWPGSKECYKLGFIC